MKSCKHKTGVTLVEILIVVAVIAILVSMVIGIAARIDSQGKERLTENTFALLDSALGQFQDYGYRHKDYSVYPTDDERDFYRSLDFPIDCTGLSDTEFKNALKNVLDAGSVEIPSGAHDPNYSGSEALYFFLSRVPESRQTLDKIDRKLVTNLGLNGNPMKITIGSGGDIKEYPLMRVIDPWGTTLRYDYYDERESNFKERKKGKKNFPVITSAGPDKIFGTGDDITSRD